MNATQLTPSTISDMYAATTMRMYICATKAPQSRVSKIATDEAHKATNNTNGEYTGKLIPDDLRKKLDMHAQRARRCITNDALTLDSGNIVIMTASYVDIRNNCKQHQSDYITTVEEATENWDEYRAVIDELTDGLYAEDILPETRDEYLSYFKLRVWGEAASGAPSHIVLTGDMAAEYEQEIIDSRDQEFASISRKILESMDKTLGVTLEQVTKGARISGRTFAKLEGVLDTVHEFNNPVVESVANTVDTRIQAIIDSTRMVLKACDFKRITKDQSQRDLLARQITQIQNSVRGQVHSHLSRAA